MKLHMEVRHSGDVTVVHCRGRIVYRDEAEALACVVADVLDRSQKVVLDLTEVRSLDSTGIGKLALLHSYAQTRQASLAYAGANALVRRLLRLTQLDSVLELHGTLEQALSSDLPDLSRDSQLYVQC